MHELRGAPGLKAHHVGDPPGFGGVPQLDRLFEICPQGPFAEGMLPGLERRHDHLVVQGDPHADVHQVDVRVAAHLHRVVEGQRDVVPAGCLLGRLLTARADGHQLQLRQLFDGRDVRPRAPAVVDVRPDDADTNVLPCHGSPTFYS